MFIDYRSVQGSISLLCVCALQLLGELLLDRHNYTVMTRYISSPENLKLMMNMLRDRSRNIQFEAFHVFKVIGRVQDSKGGRGLEWVVNRLEWVTESIRFSSAGFRGQSQQDPSGAGHPAQEPGETHRLPLQVPQRQIR